MAAILCVSAAVNSILPVNPRGASWHFWLTTIGVTVFWVSFYLLGRMVSQGKSFASIGSAAAITTMLGLTLSVFVVVVSVLIFAVSFGVALAKH
jgi:hypothetical protein